MIAKRMLSVALIATSFGSILFAGVEPGTEQDPAGRLHEAAQVFSAITATSDTGIPRDLIDRAKCVVIVPGTKKPAAADRIGFVSCRAASNNWSTPGAVRMDGIDTHSDVVMLVMDDRGARKLLLESGFMVGADVAVTSWSRSSGAFAGISLRGAMLREDLDDNQAMYGARISNRDIVGQQRLTPGLTRMLTRYSPVTQ